MSKLDQVQLGSTSFGPEFLFDGFQTLGHTTNFEVYPAALAAPVAIAGSSGVNPVGLIDNRKRRATSVLLGFMMTAANNAHVAFDLTMYSKVVGSSLYVRTQIFLGAAEAGNIDVSTPMAEATAFVADNFSTKTLASGGIAYIEPTADLSFALIIADIRGADYLMVRLAQGGATAATKAQVFYGFN